MPAQSWRQLAALRSPANQDTTWRVRRQSAIQTQQALALHRTNDHSSSSSSTSSGRAGDNVASRCGKPKAFFLTRRTPFGGPPRKCAQAPVGWSVRGRPLIFRPYVLRCNPSRGPVCRNGRNRGSGISACPPWSSRCV